MAATVNRSSIRIGSRFGKLLIGGLQGFSPDVGDDRHNDIVKHASKDLIQTINSQIDAMVGDSPLGIVIGADTFTPIPGAYLTFPILGNSVVPFLLQPVE